MPGRRGRGWPELFAAPSLRGLFPDCRVLVRAGRALELGWPRAEVEPLPRTDARRPAGRIGRRAQRSPRRRVDAGHRRSGLRRQAEERGPPSQFLRGSLGRRCAQGGERSATSVLRPGGSRRRCRARARAAATGHRGAEAEGRSADRAAPCRHGDRLRCLSQGVRPSGDSGRAVVSSMGRPPSWSAIIRPGSETTPVGSPRRPPKRRSTRRLRRRVLRGRRMLRL